MIKTPIGVEVESSDEKGVSREPAQGADAPANGLEHAALSELVACKRLEMRLAATEHHYQRAKEWMNLDARFEHAWALAYRAADRAKAKL